MSPNSSRSTPNLTLAIRFRNLAAEFLTEFANTRADDFERFESRWTDKGIGYMGWYYGTGREVGIQTFQEVQQQVRDIWEGKHKGEEGSFVARGLSLVVPRQEPGLWDTSQQLFHVSWESGFIWASPRDQGDYVWLSLLQYSKQLAVCANKENDCPAPYFIRKKANQKFCSEICAAPAQREFKRQWFREHGTEWRQKWLKRKKSAKKSHKRR